MIQNNPELVYPLIALILGGIEVYRRYRKTGTIPLKTLPWRAIRKLFYEVRKTLFPYPKPENKVQTVDLPIESVKAELMSQGYEPKWPLSYHYQGEDGNLRKYMYRPDHKYPHQQTHIRLWDENGKTGIYAHNEPSALAHPKAHLDSKHMSDTTRYIIQAYLS